MSIIHQLKLDISIANTVIDECKCLLLFFDNNLSSGNHEIIKEFINNRHWEEYTHPSLLKSILIMIENLEYISKDIKQEIDNKLWKSLNKYKNDN